MNRAWLFKGTTLPLPAVCLALWVQVLCLPVLWPMLVPGRVLCAQVVAQASVLRAPESTAPTGLEDKSRVTLYLSPHDKKGRSITDLKPEELSISDAGHKVDSRELQIAEEAEGGDQIITLIFDRLDAAGSRNAARAAGSLLKNLGAKTSAIGVWSIGDRLRVVQPYTLDRNLLQNAIHSALTGQVAPGDAHRQAPPVVIGDDQDERSSRQKSWDLSTDEAVRDAGRIATERQMPRGLATLLAAAQSQKALHGRKAIVYFTQTIPSDLNAADMVRTVSRSLRDASISVFVVDLNAIDEDAAQGMQAAMAMGGLSTTRTLNPAPKLTGPASGFQSLVTPSEATQIGDTITGLELDGKGSNKNLMTQLADSTGGLYIASDTNSKQLCRRLTSDLASYYTVSYPEAGHLDGHFHTVVVTVLRKDTKPEATLGYFGIRGKTGSVNLTDATLAAKPDEDDEPAGVSGLTAGATDPSLLLHASMLRLGTVRAGMRSAIAVEVPVNELSFHEDQNTNLFSLHVTVAAEIKDASGAPVARFHEEFRRRGAIDSEDKMRSRFFTMTRMANLPAGKYEVDAAVRDWNSGTTGKVTQTVELTDADDAAMLSDLVLVRDTLVRDASSGDTLVQDTDEKEGSTEASALTYGHAAVVPNLSGRLEGASRQASLYFQVYPEEAKPRSDDALRLEVTKGGKLLASMPLRLDPLHPHEVSSRLANVMLGSGSGTYDLTLCLERDGHVTKRRLSVVSEDPKVDASAADGAEEGIKFTAPSIDQDLKQSHATLTATESAAMIATAREHALAYSHTLPNFMCIETIDRYFDSAGKGIWKHRDSMGEVLRYVDETETRSVFEVDGKKSHLAADHIEGAHSKGEFGGILRIIFDPSADAHFEWEKTEEKDGQLLQVFRFAVDAGKSQFSLTDHSGRQVLAPFHGVVMVDNDTRSVRRLLAQADGLPRDFGIRGSWMAIDYDYIAINGHEYLLPISGEVGLQEGKREAVSNHLRFSNYRRYGSRVRVMTGSIAESAPH